MTSIITTWYDESHSFAVEDWNALVMEALDKVDFKVSGVSNGELLSPAENLQHGRDWISQHVYSKLDQIEQSKVKLKVTLSRELTLSERELFRVEFIELPSGDVTHKFQEPHVLILESEGDPLWSRQLAWDLHEFLASEFFNVHIRAVHTLSPKVVV